MNSARPGFGYAISRARRSPSGSTTEWNVTAVVGAETTIVALAAKAAGRALWKYVSCWGRDRKRAMIRPAFDDSPDLPRIQYRNPQGRDQS